jgi:uncharacterized protein (DUF3820 family)
MMANSNIDYEDWQFPFGKYSGKTLSEIPDTYLDWLIGQDWFVKRRGNRYWLQAIGQEMETRKRSHYHVSDDFDKTLEDD